jgi:hypothetical protein
MSEYFTRLANVPSRDHLQRRELRADYAENIARLIDWKWRRAMHSGNAVSDTTWEQMAKGCGYPPTTMAYRSLKRYLDHLQEAGIMTYGGQVDAAGQWRCLHVELLEPPPLSVVMRRSSSAGQAPSLCQARRRHETRAQVLANRRRRWCRKGGRAESKERHALSWRPITAHSSFGENGPYGLRPRGAVRSQDGCARARGTSGPPEQSVPGPASKAAGEGGGAPQRRGFRKPKRQAAALERFAFRNEQLVLELVLCGDLDRHEAQRRVEAIRARAGRC